MASELVGGVLAAAAFGIAGVLKPGLMGARTLRRGIALWRTGPVSVVEAQSASGRVTVVGTAAPVDEPLSSPFVGEDAVAVSWSVKESRGLNGTESVRIARGTETTQFRVEDGSGAIRVDPDGAHLVTATQTTVENDRAEENEHVERFDRERDPYSGIAKAVSTLYEWLPVVGPNRRYIERRIEPGEEVLVHGTIDGDHTATASGAVNAAIRDGSGPFVVASASSGKRTWEWFAGAALFLCVAAVFVGVAGYLLWLVL